MAVTKTWSVVDLTRETSDDYVSWVHWKLMEPREIKPLSQLARPSLKDLQV